MGKTTYLNRTQQNADVQHPLPVDGDQVYAKDIDPSSSLSVGWVGEITDLFDEIRDTSLSNSTSNNPKIITIELKRAMQTNIFGFATSTGNFSNTRIYATFFDGSSAIIFEESTDNTKKALVIVQDIPPIAFTGLRIEFHTADEVTLTGIAITKALQNIVKLQAVTSTGQTVNVGATVDGDLTISDNSDGLAIAEGNVTGKTFVHKFGASVDFDFSDGRVTVWDGADDGNINQMVYQYSATDDIDTISSSNAGDTQDIQIEGLDINYNEVIQTATLDGQNKVTLSTPLFRLVRMINIGSTDLAGYVYSYVDTAITAGVPNDSTTVRGVIQAINNQTLMAIYTVPAGKTAYVRDWFSSTAGAKKSTNYAVALRARPFGQVFQLKHASAISDSATSYIQHNYNEPEVFQEKTDIEMICQIQDATVTEGAVSAGFDIVLVDN